MNTARLLLVWTSHEQAYRRRAIMAIEEIDMALNEEKLSIEAGTFREDCYKSVPPESDDGPGFVVSKTPTASVRWWRGIVSLYGTRYLLPVALLCLILLALLAACAQTQQAQDPAGT